MSSLSFLFSNDLIIGVLLIILIVILYFAIIGVLNSKLGQIAVRYKKTPPSRAITAIPFLGQPIHLMLLEYADRYNDQYLSPTFDRFWGLNKSDQITIVAPTAPYTEKTKEFLYFEDKIDHLYFRRYGDVDAFVHLFGSILRQFEKAKVDYYYSKEFSDLRKQGEDLIIIGGPDFNDTCERFMSDIPIRFEETGPECESDIKLVDDHNGEEYTPEFDDSGNIEKDYGLFAKFPHPEVNNYDVYMISGIRTHGVIGSSKCFISWNGDMLESCAENCKKVLNHEGNDPHFAVPFSVECTEENVNTPDIDDSKIISL